MIQKANQLYRDGQYEKAVALFEEAEQYVPNQWLLWLNKGYTCRNILIPGAKTPENDRAVKCAIDSFKKLQQLKPDDHRGPALYEQTLFESDQFETLAQMYQERVRKNPKDEEAIIGLIQVYSKWPGHSDEALEWHKKKAELKPTDAEVPYTIGVYIWQQLFSKGGGPDKTTFDPRVNMYRKKKVKEPPPFSANDIVAQQRVDLADEGIKYLEKAVELRPKYHEAMAYLNLLYRQKAFAYFEDHEKWWECMVKATEWRDKTLLAMGKPIPKPGEEEGEEGGAAGDSSSNPKAETSAATSKKAKAAKKKRPGKARKKKK